ncbi:MAG: hypothetical protein A2Z17_00500 [Gammaproteobacteria bacterium RBG_16_66_13]|jgi:hypothetical protein|nr:MAG: hypothetical protein A2Z17_00500 [Gammaproteobacteria bacterium RBG_16_66_13]
MPSQEQERLRRLRDQQLRARDPLSKQRRMDKEISQKRRRMRETFSFGGMWRDLPHRLRGAFVGGLIGLGVLLVAPSLIAAPWGLCLGGFALPFAALVGFLLGRYDDSMDDIKKDLH